MIASLLSFVAVVFCWSGPLQDAPATQPASSYERALAGVRGLYEENLKLRARVAQLEQEALPAMRIRAGDALHVRLDEFQGLGPDAHLAEVRWDFGDEESAYNVLGGFNAAHVYERPGNYTISLNNRAVRRVEVLEDARKTWLAATEAELAAAVRIAGAVVRIAPGTISVGQTLKMAPGTTLVGDPAGSTLLWTGARGGMMIDVPSGRATIRNITFDTAGAPPFEKVACTAIHPGGSDIAVIGCTFLNVNDGINGNRRPGRVLVQDCRAPSETGIRSYLAWVEGDQWVLLGNIAVNSTREHIIRIGASGPQAPGNRFLLVAYNDFNNIDRRAAAQEADKTDIAKSCLIFQVGEYGWAEHNLIRGSSGVGPLGGPDGMRDPNRRFRYAVFRDNRHLDTLHIDDGSEHVLIAHSRFELPDSGGNGFSSIQVAGLDEQFNRRVVDLTLRNCVLVSPFMNACQLWIKGAIGERFEMVGNTFVAGRQSYKWGTMPVIIEGGWQEAYRSSGNELPPPPGGWPDKKAFARFGHQNDESGYVTMQRWLSLPGVSADSVGTVGMKVP